MLDDLPVRVIALGLVVVALILFVVWLLLELNEQQHKWHR
jgi:hypothetical protein